MALTLKVLNVNSRLYDYYIIISNTINSWCCVNNMVIGIDKTKCMLMGSERKPRTTVNSEKCLNWEVREYKIKQVTSQKLSGIQIDNSLTWNEQITKVKKTVLSEGR